VNVLAVVLIARLGRRLSGTTHERLAAPTGDAAIRRAPRMTHAASDRGVTGNGLDQPRELREAGDPWPSLEGERPVAETIS
jgi:hypothetical protein